MAASLPEMPCGPVLELNGQRKRFHVPFGLKPLLDEMIRKVLRDQPDNIHEYLACFMEARVQEKEAYEKIHRKSWEVHRWSWEASSVLSDEDLNLFLQTLSAEPEVANHYATVIQTAFRGHLARDKMKELRNSKDLEEGGPLVGNVLEAKQDQAQFEDELYEEDDLEETEQEGSEYDYEDGNVAEDEDEDYTQTYDGKESEEEFETEVDTTFSEIDGSVEEEMEIVQVKSPPALSRFELDKLTSKTAGEFPENEEAEHEEEEED